MVERRPVLTMVSHLVLLGGVALVMFPIWVAFVASTHPSEAMMSGRVPLWPGGLFH